MCWKGISSDDESEEEALVAIKRLGSSPALKDFPPSDAHAASAVRERLWRGKERKREK